MSGGGLRLDKWLFFARFCKSRSLAAELCAEGLVLLNGAAVAKPAHLVRPGDVVEVPVGSPFGKRQRVMRVRVLALADRRGPAPTARELYEEIR